MGRAFKELKVVRKDIVVSTKIFKCGDGPNDSFLSRKHIIEGLRNSLARLQMDNVDVVFCHRPDYLTPLEETCRAMSWCIDQGLAFYWGTSEWTAARITEAVVLCERLGLHKPVVEQSLYNMFSRDRFEKDYKDIFERFGYGTTIWSALAGGLLTGKYNNGEVPPGTRYKDNPMLESVLEKYFGPDVKEKTVQKMKALEEVAKGLGCTQAQLCLAWAIANGDVSTCILGFTKTSQVE
jgi:aryl-alcohol dehydrogenase-like predicted oxidoreductase